MSSSIKKHYVHCPSQEQIENRRIMTSVLTDLDSLNAVIVALGAKLDADSGATGGDSDYAAVMAALQTSDLIA